MTTVGMVPANLRLVDRRAHHSTIEAARNVNESEVIMWLRLSRPGGPDVSLPSASLSSGRKKCYKNLYFDVTLMAMEGKHRNHAEVRPSIFKMKKIPNTRLRFWKCREK